MLLLVSNLQDKNEKRVKSTVFPESEDDMKLVKSAASKDLNRKLVQKLTGVCERLSMVHQLEEWFFFTKLKRNVQESEDAMETLRGEFLFESHCGGRQIFSGDWIKPIRASGGRLFQRAKSNQFAEGDAHSNNHTSMHRDFCFTPTPKYCSV